jgi:hypothetical protein
VICSSGAESGSVKGKSRRSVLPMRTAVAACAVIAIAGCATFEPPKAWEKGDLARRSMRLEGDVLAAKVTAHIYQSKEGAAGGGTVGGGGCGCN